MNQKQEDSQLIAQTPAGLSAFQQMELKEKGYLLLDILDDHQTAKLRDDFMAQFADSHQSEGFNTTMNVSVAALREKTDQYIKARFQEVVSNILPGYRILFSNFLFKKANSSSAVGIHRDWHYVDESKHSSFNLWIPLIDINESSGRFFVLPGSHNIPHGPRATPFTDNLKPLERPIRKLSVPISLKAGQGILYHSGLIHFSDSNQSPTDRPAIGMVNIPLDAINYHYHRSELPNAYLRYQVDDQFYYHFNPQNLPPHHYQHELITDDKSEDFTGPWLMEYARNTHQSADVVADYYDQHTAGYMSTYGEAIQAFRPSDIKTLYKYLIKSIGLNNGMKILDAGCGIGGPATYFARKLKLDIKGITISKVQVEMAQKHIQKHWWLRGKVEILQGDYHHLQEIFPSSDFDGVLFLESMGHAYDLKRVIQQAHALLKPGGFIYIKDFFPYEKTDPEEQRKYQWVVDRINTAYAYNVLDLNELIQTIRRQGFEISFIKKFDFKDDIQARAAFEEMCQIDLFGNIQEFRVAEWLEIKCIKP